MRLIDADALKKKAVMCPTVGNSETLLLDISDVENAPTIEESKTMTHEEAVGFLQESGWLQDHDRQIYEQGKRDGIEEHKTGRWNDDGTCSVCGTYSSLNLSKVKYCPECGAEMKGGAE